MISTAKLSRWRACSAPTMGARDEAASEPSRVAVCSSLTRWTASLSLATPAGSAGMLSAAMPGNGAEADLQAEVQRQLEALPASPSRIR